MYLLWFELHWCYPGWVDHGPGPPQVFYDAVPLGWQAHEAATLGVERRVDPVLKVLWRRYFRPLLFLLAEHRQLFAREPCRDAKRAAC